ncbi:hypothetical protein EJ419_01035 [Alloscardovia theropitheci]|uniref:Uncharacterized protein n=1 Tax=Alloscardovia theropitheci TaxID=2496842 RepID=A0A4R0QRL1_9BIFI|nr:hypothetical protein [Alloscardovia theropitheci]TCD55004.1 hypothetical protein EJ419_01035 [Alloscardovia theropitheci]
MDKFVVKQEEVSELQTSLSNTSSLLEQMARTDTSAAEVGEKVNSALNDLFNGLDDRRDKITKNTTKLAEYLGKILEETTNLDNDMQSVLTQSDESGSSSSY